MSESKLRTQSMDFAVQIISLVKSLKEKENLLSPIKSAEAVLLSGQISVRRSMHMAKQILLQNFKLRSKKQMKQAIGLNCYIGQITFANRNINPLILLVQASVLCSSPL